MDFLLLFLLWNKSIINIWIKVFNRNKVKDSSANKIYSSNYFSSLEQVHIERIVNKTKNELELYIKLTNNSKDDTLSPEVNEDVQWYIERLKSIINEWEEILFSLSSNPNNSNKNKQYVSDHTYDISEIFPYSVFLANEDVLRKDLE